MKMDAAVLWEVNGDWKIEEVDIDPRKLKDLDDDDDLPTSL